MTDLFGLAGTALLNDLELADAYAIRVDSLRQLLKDVDREVSLIERHTARALAGHEGFRAIQAIPGVGPILGAVFVAEVGDVGRFSRPEQLCSWAGLTPRHRESDTTVRRGGITKMACGAGQVDWPLRYSS